MAEKISLTSYKGYYGSIKASIEDNCLYGKLQFIHPLMSYEAQTPAELKAAFEAAMNVGEGRSAKSINDLVIQTIDHELERLGAI